MGQSEQDLRDQIAQAGDSLEQTKLWLLVGVMCCSRGLHAASYLAYDAAEQMAESVQQHGPAYDVVRFGLLHRKFALLAEMGEAPGALAAAAILEAADQRVEHELVVPTLDELLEELGLTDEDAAELREEFRSPSRARWWLDQYTRRFSFTVPDFWMRFATGSLALEDTRGADAAHIDISEEIDACFAASWASRRWLPEAEDEFRRALRFAAEAGIAALLADIWQHLGDHFLTRMRPDLAGWSYATSYRYARDTADAYRTSRAFSSLTTALVRGRADGWLACLVWLEHSDSDQALVDRLWQWLSNGPRQRWHRIGRTRRVYLRHPQRCRAEMQRALGRVSAAAASFAAGFADGSQRCDDPIQMFAAMREPAEAGTAFEANNRAIYRHYRRRWLQALLVRPVVLVGAAAGLVTAGRGWLGLAGTIAGGVLAAVVLLAGGAIWWPTVRARRRWVRRSAMEVTFAQKLRQAGRSRGSHQLAYAVLEGFANDRTPFALFLRSFETEASEHVPSSTAKAPGQPSRQMRLAEAFFTGNDPYDVDAAVGSDRMISMVLRDISRTETRLNTVVGEHYPLIAVANPVSYARAVPGQTMQLELAHGSWREAVEMIASAARLIVVECDTISSGLLIELDLLRAARRMGDTVLVLPSTETVGQLETYRHVNSIAVGEQVRAQDPIATADHPALDGFTRIIRDDELLTADAAQHAAFAGLLS